MLNACLYQIVFNLLIKLITMNFYNPYVRMVKQSSNFKATCIANILC